jgi:thiosulfate/3-mercaptopyruvate sulfurtransferase
MNNVRFINNRIAYLFIFLAFVLSSTINAQELPSKLVNTEWLASNLSAPDLRIVDVRDSVAAYWLEHIPGAVYLSPDALRWPEEGVPVKLIPPKNLSDLLEEMGIGNKTTVIIYSEKGDYKAPYLQWALDYIAHPQSGILDGGFSKWKNEGRSVTQDYPKITPAIYRNKLDRKVRADLKQVKNFVANGGAVLIDVRPAELYAGEKGNWKRKGHIKGAINHFWSLDLNEDGTWKSKDELKKIYEDIGATPDKIIVVSCGQGQMSAHSYFTLKHILGYPYVMNYDGSFNEWSNIDELPVEGQ